MAKNSTVKAEEVAANLRKKLGDKALYRAAAVEVQVASLSTGHTSLDAALGIGGVPRKAITEMIGIGTSGMTSTAMNIVATANRLGDIAAWIDLGHCFDPYSASLNGIDLEKTFLVRPDGGGQQGLDIAFDLVEADACGVVVIDSLDDLLMESGAEMRLSALLGKMNRVLPKSRTAVLMLHPIFAGVPEGSHAVSTNAAVRIRFERSQWIEGHRGETIEGIRSVAHVLKNKYAKPWQEADIEVIYKEGLGG